MASVAARAQFYAPETDYHDPVQRVFPVEAARVVAWIGGATNINQVTYQTTNKNGETTWDLRWLDVAGKPVKSITISYPGDRLKTGPEFYRSVFKQLWAMNWGPAPSLKPEEARRQFWQGANRIRLSREESLTQLINLAPGASASKVKERSAELAGLLVHSTLPGLADRVTLDGILVARGAAWLALAEEACGSKLGELWTPVLFLAGRDRAAAALWTKPQSTRATSATPQELGWDILVQKPTSRNIFVFATEHKNLAMAMPMLAYDGWVNGSRTLLADLIPELAGGEKALPALHNYAPMFAQRTTISGGHLLDGAWAIFSRQAWLDLLAAHRPTPNDFQGHSQLLTAAVRAIRTAMSNVTENQDSSLIGFKECVPLLRLAYKEGQGPLIPVGTVTTRDLLNYGWEMAGLQMGGRYYFVQRLWGVKEQARPILRTTVAEVPGVMPFFLSTQYAKNPDYVDSLRRLQMLDGFFQRVEFNPHPLTGIHSQPREAAMLWVRRCWMRPLDFEWQARTLWDAAHEEIVPLIEAFADQQGPLAAAEVLRYLSYLNSNALAQIPGATNLIVRLAERLPQPSRLYIDAIYSQKPEPVDVLAHAQELERLYWKSPESEIEPRVFLHYTYIGAYDSARRFYKQCRRNMTDTVQFSNTMGQPAWVLGYLTKDTELRRMALEDSNSGSSSDMLLNIWEAAARRDHKKLKEQTAELAERYGLAQGQNSLGNRLSRFMPLLPALLDPKHPQRDDALDYFGKEDVANILRWIWINEYKLPRDDAIRFLGARESSPLFRVMAGYLDKDSKKTGEAVEALEEDPKLRDDTIVTFARFLNFDLQADRKAPKDVDLRPADATSVRELVQAKLGQRRK